MILSGLDPHDPLFLPRWILWRNYGWVLDAPVQNQLQFPTVSNGKQFYEIWLQVKNTNGIEAMKVTIYSARFWPNVPQTVIGMQPI